MAWIAKIALALLSLHLSIASAQEYPGRAIRIVVPLGAGGPTDTVTRILADALSARLKVPVIVENRTGGGGTVGMSSVIRSEPDGYTLGILNDSSGISGPELMKSPPYDSLNDTTMIGCMATFQMFLIVPALSPAKTVDDLRMMAARKSTGIIWASGSAVVQIAGEHFRELTGMRALRVPYPGEPDVIRALLDGSADYGFVHGPAIKGYADADSLIRILAVVDTQRSPSFPHVKTMKEAGGPELSVPSVSALAGPRGLSRATVDMLNRSLRNALSDPAVLQRLEKASATPWICSPDELAAWVSKTRASVRHLIDSYGIPKR